MYNAVASNKRNTVIIFIVFFLIIGGLGFLAGYVYQDWLITIFVMVIAGIYALIQYFASGSIAMSVNGGREVTRENASELVGIIKVLSTNYGVPEPRVFIIDDPSPNAFATGRNPKHSMIAVTTGLINKLDRRELKAVVAHEMSHVKNYDILVSVIVFGLVSAIGIISDLVFRISFSGGGNRDSSPVIMIFGLVAMIIAPIIAMLVRLALSRQREYLADASSVLTTRDVKGLVLALEKIKDDKTVMRRQNTSTEHLWFSSPLKKDSLKAKLFSTHPPIEERIKRLNDSISDKSEKM